MSRAGLMVKTSLMMASVLLLWGCSSSSNDKAPQFNSATGQHPAGWIQNHWAEYVQHPEQCRGCHGSTTDPTSTGGVAKISCFKCHGSPDHTTGWSAPAQHGRLGAQAAPNPDDATAMAGFVHCTKCHGSDYSGGISGISCKSCHTKAPHPDKPWIGTTVSQPSHTITSFQNASECYKCHKDGANSDRVPTTPAPAGTEPGCFNNTMCHGNSI